MKTLNTAHGQPLRPNTSIIDGGGGRCRTGTSGRRELEQQHVSARPEDYAIFTAGDAEDEKTVEDGEELHAEELESNKVLPTSDLPSQDIIDEHWLDHLQYRNWCGCCVNGRGRERPHLRTNGKRKIPTLGFDYCFASKDGIFSRYEWKNMPDGVKGVKMLVARELVSKATFAHVVDNKGLGEDGFAAACLVKDVDGLVSPASCCAATTNRPLWPC